jgi:hypothetical protein
MIRASFVLAVVLAVATAAAQAPPDFTGTWTMDEARSVSATQDSFVGPVVCARFVRRARRLDYHSGRPGGHRRSQARTEELHAEVPAPEERALRSAGRGAVVSRLLESGPPRHRARAEHSRAGRHHPRGMDAPARRRRVRCRAAGEGGARVYRARDEELQHRQGHLRQNGTIRRAHRSRRRIRIPRARAP